jgi:hypothetical protein
MLLTCFEVREAVNKRKAPDQLRVELRRLELVSVRRCARREMEGSGEIE